MSAAVKESEETAAHHALLAKRRAEANSKLNGLRKQLGSNGVPYSARSSARSNTSSAAFSARKNLQSAQKGPSTQRSHAAAYPSEFEKNTRSEELQADSSAACERSQEEARQSGVDKDTGHDIPDVSRREGRQGSSTSARRSSTSARGGVDVDANRDVAKTKTKAGQQNTDVAFREGSTAVTVNGSEHSEASQNLHARIWTPAPGIVASVYPHDGHAKRARANEAGSLPGAAISDSQNTVQTRSHAPTVRAAQPITVPPKHNHCTVEISDSDDDDQVRAGQAPAKNQLSACSREAPNHAMKNVTPGNVKNVTPSNVKPPSATRANTTAGNEHTQIERGRMTKKHIRAALVIQEWYRQRKKTRMFRNLAAAAGSRQTHHNTPASHDKNLPISADICSTEENARVLKAGHAAGSRGSRGDTNNTNTVRQDETGVRAHCEVGHEVTTSGKAGMHGVNTAGLLGEISATTPQHTVKKKPGHEGLCDSSSKAPRILDQGKSDAQQVAATTIQRVFRGYLGQEAARKQRQMKRVALLNGESVCVCLQNVYCSCLVARGR